MLTEISKFMPPTQRAREIEMRTHGILNMLQGSVRVAVPWRTKRYLERKSKENGDLTEGSMCTLKLPLVKESYCQGRNAAV